MTGLLVLLTIAAVPTVIGLLATRDPSTVERRRERLRSRTTTFVESITDRFEGRRGLAAFLGGTVVVLLAVTWAAGIVVMLFAVEAATPVDEWLTDWFLRGRTPALSTTWNVITFAGDSSLLLPAAVIGGLWWRWRRGDWFAMSLLVGAYSGAALLFNTAKRLVNRPRPAADIAFNQETGMAFPSGHTTDTAGVYAAVALLLTTVLASWAVRRLIAVSAGTIIVLVAASRLYLGAHWFTDVIWGAILGTVWAGLLWVALTAPSGPYPRRERLGIASDRERDHALSA